MKYDESRTLNVEVIQPSGGLHLNPKDNAKLLTSLYESSVNHIMNVRFKEELLESNFK